MGGAWNSQMRQVAKHYATLPPAEVAAAERDRVLSVVAAGHPDALHLALSIIIGRRDQGGPFSANDVRSAMDAARIPTSVRGTAFGMAKRRHLIASVGFEQSTDKGTHAKRVELYADPFPDARRGPVSAHPARGAVPADPPRVAQPGEIAQAAAERAPRRRQVRPARVEEITVPVHRSRGGQFSTTSDIAPEQGDLFAELGA